MIIVVANSKGGVGKTTIAVHLAAWLVEQGHRVTFCDCDAQESSSHWIREALPEVKLVRLATTSEIHNDLTELANDADFVVADGPGSDVDRARALLLLADLAIVPAKASMLEVRALAAATEALRHAQHIRQGKPHATVVLSMVGKHYRLTKDMRDAAAALKLPLATKAVTLRQVYADAPGQGAVVWQLGSRAGEASGEIESLFEELLPDAARRAVKRTRRSILNPK
jgi:chromosome partitioning protein